MNIYSAETEYIDSEEYKKDSFYIDFSEVSILTWSVDKNQKLSDINFRLKNVDQVYKIKNVESESYCINPTWKVKSTVINTILKDFGQYLSEQK